MFPRSRLPVLLNSPRWWVFRDTFTGDLAAGNVNNTPATPGPGLRTVTDAESTIQTNGGYLRGLDQHTTPVWGEAKVVYPALARKAGRALFGLVRLTDAFSELAFGWATATDIGDPSADGHGWLMESGGLNVITPGAKAIISSDRHEIRPMQYLIGTVLTTSGAYVLLSTFAEDAAGAFDNLIPFSKPAYPTALLLLPTRTGTDASLYPYVSGQGAAEYDYYLGHAIADLRAVDLGPGYDFDNLAAFSDLFTRADSALTIGNNWTADVGVWGISSNAAYCVSGAGFRAAWHESGLSDGTFTWTFTTPAADTEFWLVFRRASAGNYMRVRISMAGAGAVAVQVFQGGAFHASVHETACAFVENTTYQVTVIAYGHSYQVYVNNVNKFASWRVDADDHFLTGTGVGFSSGTNDSASPRFSDIAVHPLTVTLPAVVGKGAVPLYSYTTGATLAQDTFTDANGTDLDDHAAEAGGAWTMHVGNWEINGNTAQYDFQLADTSSEALCSQDVGAQDVEVSVDITTPAAWAPGDGGTNLGAGIIGRYIDANNYLGFRCRLDAAQMTDGEVEVVLQYPGHNQVSGKVYLGDAGTESYSVGTTYTLKAVFKGDTALCFLDDNPVLSFVIPPELNGTRFGLSQMDDNRIPAGAATFDNWTVKAI